MNKQSLVEDEQIIGLVDQIDQNELKRMGDFVPTDLSHYLRKQIPWLQDEKYFLGHKLDREPMSRDFAHAVLSSGHTLRFRAYYSLKYPNRIRQID